MEISLISLHKQLIQSAAIFHTCYPKDARLDAGVYTGASSLIFKFRKSISISDQLDMYLTVGLTEVNLV